MKNCYRCGKELSIDEIIAGIIKLDESGHAEQVEDFVNCTGEDSEFITEKDKELIKRLKSMENRGFGKPRSYVRSVIVCENCVQA